MTQNEIVLAAFEGRVRQLILRFQELKKENEELYRMVDKNEEDIKALQEKLSRNEQDYNALKMARMVEITDGDLQGAKDRLSKLIREVNKCIAVLSDENKK
jgi:predicted  nucleic acid-binding Zn-ribbon protein